VCHPEGKSPKDLKNFRSFASLRMTYGKTFSTTY